MENIIQKDGKYYQIVYPVLLPTSVTRPNNHVDGEENMYILSDEEIKELP